MVLKGCVAAGIIVVLAGVATLASLGQVDQNQYGLVFNWITKKIGNEVNHGGLHFIGFWNTFVTFPATVQTIEFSDRQGSRTAAALHTRTKEGLALHLSISFQYKLHADGLPALYALTNLQYENLFVRIARDQLLEVASDYEGPQYWLARKEIGDKMRKRVSKELGGSHASLWDLQLLRIDLPDQYEESITKTQVQQQLIKTKQNEQQAASIRADTEIMKAEYERQIRVVEAGAEANYTLVTQVAEGKAAKRKIAAEADALRYVRHKLRLSTAGAVEYQQLGAYAGLKNATILANVASATPVISAGKVAGMLQTSKARVHTPHKDGADSPANAAGATDAAPADVAAAAVADTAVGTTALSSAPVEPASRKQSRRLAFLARGSSMLQLVCRLH